MGRYFAAAVCAGIGSWLVLFSLETTSTAIAGFPLVLRLLIFSILGFGLYLGFVIFFHWSLSPLRMFFSLVKIMLPKYRTQKTEAEDPKSAG